MRKELAERFNEEVKRFRQMLLHHAERCDWDAFKIKAGKLFDYVEEIELRALGERFFKTFWAILVILAAIVLAIFKIDVAVYPALLRLKNSIILLALAGSCFALYFFLDFKMYVKAKMSWYKKRKEQFIRNIEKDFKDTGSRHAACP